jgi:hypothetical protein
LAWFVHYWDEINNRNIRSSEISAREDAMRKACSLTREGYVVSHVAGPYGERIDIVDIRVWCSAHASHWSHAIPPLPAAVDRRGPCAKLDEAARGADSSAGSGTMH